MRSSCVLAISALLAACNDGQPAVAEASPAEPAKVALLFRVIREGGGGIDATINRIDAQGQVSLYAAVPVSGEKAFYKPCEAGQRFQAEPKVAAFLRGPTQDCAERIEFMLLSAQATLQFIKRGDDAARGGDLLVAQSNYGTAADRLQYAEPDKARRLRVLSIVAAGRSLGVTQPVQGADGSEQPAQEFSQRVREFQTRYGIEATGDLDARTRECIRRMQVRGGVIVVPSATSLGTSLGALSPASAAGAPALVVTPQAVTAAVEVRMTVAEMMATPASPQTAAIIHAHATVSR